MRPFTAFGLLMVLIVGAGSMGCTRSLRPGVDDTSSTQDEVSSAENEGSSGDPGQSGAADAETAETLDSDLITIEAPLSGAPVTSPVRIVGQLDLAPGRLPAAQVLSREADGTFTRRGNGPIPVDDDGRFEATIEYVLDTAGRGAVEVVIVDPASGSVTDRERIIVDLDATP